MQGRYTRLERLSAFRHAGDLWPLVGGEQNAGLWTYMPDGPWHDRATFDAAMRKKEHSPEALFYAIVDAVSEQAVGFASLMRDEPAHRVIEVGGIVYSARLQRTLMATEAMYLMAKHVFEGMRYRRYEWKCNALNAASRAAALRLGFTFEGIFRQHMLIKGVNRDTAWFSMLDSEWPRRKREFERWLEPANFSAEGLQRTRLEQDNR